MNKTELTAAVAQKAGLSKSDAAKVLGAFFETVSEELSKGQAVQIIGFGNFEVADYKALLGFPAAIPRRAQCSKSRLASVRSSPQALR